MADKIYTKTGDTGNTSLLGGTKVPKSHLRIEAYGTVDELNSFIGLLNACLPKADLQASLITIQNNLFIIGSLLATDPEKHINMKLPKLNEEDVQMLEREIDAMDTMVPPMKNFILPGGSESIAMAHVARCVCRRAERNCVQMQQDQLFVDPFIIIYLNRLSDYLFMVARFIAHTTGVEEIKWQPSRF